MSASRLTSVEVSKRIDGALYPELVAAGGLGGALQRALDHVPGGLRASDLDTPGVLGEGDPARVADLLVGALPAGCGAARHGTARDEG